MIDRADMVIIGAGAAGLMAGIWAGRSHPHRSIVIISTAWNRAAVRVCSSAARFATSMAASAVSIFNGHGQVGMWRACQ
jgi:succinate dehydrogenase/fumarate reductase flavoprotein subunit